MNAHEDVAEVIDPQRWEGDSALGEDADDLGSTRSLSSSVLQFPVENGRRYHAFRAGQYFMPNDDKEQEAMDLVHHVSFVVLKGELYCAPVVNPTSILDIGTGTGIWAIDVADKFPEAHVIATDLSPIQPNWVPPNLEFQVDDCESPWCFNREFDFIHMRNMSGAIADWPKLMERCYRYLKPGGWLEVVSMEAWGQMPNGSLTEKSASYRWQHNLKQAADAIGRDLNMGPQLEGLIKGASFVNVTDDPYIVPMSPWMPGEHEIAHVFQYLALLELEALSLRLYTTVLGWSAEELEALLVGVREEIKNPANQMYCTIHYVYGQKPTI